MKLKPVVATMCVLGLSLAGAAFAAGNVNAQISNLQSQIQQLQAQVNGMGSGSSSSSSSSNSSSMSGLVSLNSQLSQQLNGDQMLVGQDLAVLNDAKNGMIANGLTIGGMLQGDVFWGHTNNTSINEGYWNNLYLDANSSTAQNRTAVTLTNAKISMLANLNSWTDAIVQLGSTYVGTDFSSNVNANSSALSADDSDVEIQQAYLLIGNLAQSPFYGFIGNRYVDFGQFANVNVFTEPLTREFFQAAGNTVGVGVNTNNINFVVSALNGGNNNSLIYATNGYVAQNTYTRNNSEINNFAANLGYGQTTNGVNWHIGAGYLNGGAWNTAEANNNSTALNTNNVYDLNGSLSVASFDFYGEYLITGSDAAVYNGATYADGGHAAGWQLAGDYKFPLMGRNSVFSLSYSQVKNANHANTTLSQYVAGLRTEAYKNVWAGLEYAYQDGMAFPITSSGVITNNGGSVANNTVTMDLTAYF